MIQRFHYLQIRTPFEKKMSPRRVHWVETLLKSYLDQMWNTRKLSDIYRNLTRIRPQSRIHPLPIMYNFNLLSYFKSNSQIYSPLTIDFFPTMGWFPQDYGSLDNRRPRWIKGSTRTNFTKAREKSSWLSSSADLFLEP